MRRTRHRQRQKRKIEKPPKKRSWLKYALVSSALAIGLAGTLAIKDSACGKKKPDSALVAQDSKPKGRFVVPPHELKIRYLAPPRRDKDFDAVDSKVLSLLKRRGHPNCPSEFSEERELGAVLARIRKALETEGHTFFSAASTPRSIMKDLHEYYFRNNVWFLLRLVGRTDHATGKMARVKCLFRYPIRKRALVSFSFFDGRLSAEGIPVYLLAGRLPGKADGTVTRKGVIIFPDIFREYPQHADTLLRDMVMHEAIHYNTIERQGGKDFNDFVDFDAGGNDNPSVLHARAKDELRAHLIEMIFGHHPKVSLMAVLNSRREGYRLAADTIARALADHIRRHDPATYQGLESGTLRIGDLGEKPIVNDDEIRHIAHRIFIRNRLWEL